MAKANLRDLVRVGAAAVYRGLGSVGAVMTDRELLELAAKAAGIEVIRSSLEDPLNRDMLVKNSVRNGGQRLGPWNPRDDDGDALRLAVELFDGDDMEVIWYRAKLLLAECPELGRVAATRRAIFHAAAEIGRNMT